MSADNEWVQSPESELVTLEEGKELTIVVEAGQIRFTPVETQYGTKYELDVMEPFSGKFRTGSRWLVKELNRHLAEGQVRFGVIREGYRISYRIRGPPVELP